jgi:hypothetical protein
MSIFIPARIFPWVGAMLMSASALLALVVTQTPSTTAAKTKATTPAFSPNAEASVSRVFDATNSNSNPSVGTASSATVKRGAPLTAADITKQATTAQGHRIEAVADGARIFCQMQDLEGLLSKNGLVIRSVDDGEPGASAVCTVGVGRTSGTVPVGSGVVAIDDATARLIRPGLIEEVTTSSDGVRQDWVIAAPPSGHGDVVLELRFDSAAITAVSDDHVALTLAGGRQVVWHRLAVSDARGMKLDARFATTAQGVQITVDDTEAIYPVRIDPTFTDADWVSMGGISGVNDSVYCMTFDQSGGLIVGGSFTVAGTSLANRIARWNGAVWSAMGSGMNGNVLALTTSGTDVYAGGAFTTAGGLSANYMAKWNGTTWSAMGTGMSSTVFALTVFGADVYAGGAFLSAGGVAAKYIAKWNGTVWSAMGTGMNNGVYAFAVSATDLYVGGGFTTVDGVSINRIAKWNGASWSALGLGLSNEVWALAVSGTDVYAGGSFTTAGGSAANNIAKWNGTTWLSMGTGTTGRVRALAVSGANVYVGGEFYSAGGVTPGYFAMWNGSTWIDMGTWTSRFVFALAVSGTDVYVGGEFTSANNVGANYIAKWNGTTWSTLGTGINNTVYSLAASGTDLYAGGYFINAGGISVSQIAKWNGTMWSALGTGTNSWSLRWRYQELTSMSVESSPPLAEFRQITLPSGMEQRGRHLAQE